MFCAASGVEAPRAPRGHRSWRRLPATCGSASWRSGASASCHRTVVSAGAGRGGSCRVHGCVALRPQAPWRTLRPACLARRTPRTRSCRPPPATSTRTSTGSCSGPASPPALGRQEAPRGAADPPPWSPCSAPCPRRPAWASRTPSGSASPPRARSPVSAGEGSKGRGWGGGCGRGLWVQVTPPHLGGGEEPLDVASGRAAGRALPAPPCQVEWAVVDPSV